MKSFAWNPLKNEMLRLERGISFEEVELGIEQERLLDIIKHPNKSKYPNQYMLVVKIKDYIYLVPFVENKEHIFLKTIIPSRKATKIYIK